MRRPVLRDVFIFLIVLIFVDAQKVKEFEEHFKVNDAQLDTVTNLLLQMKRLAHKKVYGNREFGSDAVEDSKKPVQISPQQPQVKKEISPFLFEGDIFLNQKQASNILEEIGRLKGRRGRKKNKSRKPRSFVADVEARWLDQPIRYRFHDSLEYYAISQIIQAIQYWESQTCLTFERVEDISDDDDYIEFFKGQGCYSMIGRNGGRQGVSIGENCAKMGIIEHEIGHALGLWHEQSRPDSVGYVEVQRDFILPSYMSDFLQRGADEIDNLGIPYDLGSVMHYGSTAFSADQTSKTLITRDPLYQSTIGQRETLSFYDVQVINKGYCQDNCQGAGIKCKHGGYPHPSKCDKCICPSGFGGKTCDQPEEAKNAECGGSIALKSDWVEISSPDYPDPGYEPDQKCAWIFKAPEGKRVELEFIEDFSFLCTSTCVDYVELKIGSDMKNTGFRLCCYKIPESSFVSESSTAAVLFRTQLSNDLGFKLRARATDKPPRMTPKPIVVTTTVAPVTIAGNNVWSEWGAWSDCSRSCGGCGIKSRVRHCRTKDCDGRRQEFSTCNLQACPVDKHCSKLLSSNRLCNGKVCTKATDAIARCNEPACCPPFYNKDGQCVTDEPVLSDFIARRA